MDILVEEMSSYYNALEKLGIKFVESDILDKEVDKDDVRVSFKVYDGEKVVDSIKAINDLTPEDIVNVYNLKKAFAENEDEEKELFDSVSVIGSVLKYKEEQVRLNNLLVQEFKKANNSGKFDFVLVDTEEEKKDEVTPVEEDIAKVEETIPVEEESTLLDKAKQFIKDNSAVIISGVILAGAVIYALTKVGGNKNVEKEIVQETTVVEETIPVEEETPAEEDVQEDIQEEVTPVEEEIVVELDPHSEEVINEVTDKFYEEIQNSSNEDFKIEYDRDTVEALVRYTHHNYDEYSGENYISNTDAYDKLTTIYKNGINISGLYENLDNYDRLHNLVEKCQNVKEEKGIYSDEYEAYMAMKDCMDNLNSENYPEVIAIRVTVDNTTVIPSMQLARGGALENIAAESEFQEVNENGEVVTKKVKELWIDVNGDGKITYEENAEGEDYEKEKKVASVNKDELIEIFNSVDINNENAPLTQATYKAIDEDKTFGLIK